MTMSGVREITALIKWTKSPPPANEPECGNGKLEGNEECEIDADSNMIVKAEVDNCKACTIPDCQCSPFECPCNDGGCCGGNCCNGGDCKCGNGVLDDGEECDASANGSDSKCGDGEICNNCECVSVGQPDETKSIAGECYTLCRNHSTNEYSDLFKKLNDDYYRSVTGRDDDFFCEIGQKAITYCYVRGAFKAMSAGGKTSWSASPYMITQDGGTRADAPTRNSEVDELHVINSPVRIIPIAGAQTKPSSYSFTLPDLSDSSDVQVLSGVSPMATENVIHMDNGVTIINDMISHSLQRIMATSSSSSSLPDVIQGDISKSSSDGSSTLADGVHTTEFIIPNDFMLVSTTTPSGKKVIENLKENGMSVEDVYIENRPTPEDVRLYLENAYNEGKSMAIKTSSGTHASSAITYGAPWAKNLHYKFSLAEQAFASGKAQGIGSTAVIKYSFAGTDPTMAAGGLAASSCKCSMSSDDGFNMNIILVMLIFMAIASGGLLSMRIYLKSAHERK